MPWSSKSFSWANVGPKFGIGVRRGPADADEPHSMLIELLGVSGIVLPAVIAAFGWSSVMNKVVAALSSDDPAQTATLLADAASSQLVLSILVAAMLTVTGVLNAIGMGFLIGRRFSGAAAISSGVGVALAVGAFAMFGASMLFELIGVTRLFDALGAADAAVKAAQMKGFVEEADLHLSLALKVSAGALAIGGAMILVPLLRLRESARHSTVAWHYSVVAVLVAAGLYLEARPYAAENALDIEAEERPTFLWDTADVTPMAIQGPDRLRVAPVMVFGPAYMGVDGERIPHRESLGERLSKMKAFAKYLFPGQSNRTAIAVVDPATTSERLASVLQTVRQAGYDDVLLGFRRAGKKQVRPLLGEVQRIEESGLQVKLAPQGDASGILLSSAPTFGALVPKLIEARRAGAVSISIE